MSHSDMIGVDDVRRDGRVLLISNRGDPFGGLFPFILWGVYQVDGPRDLAVLIANR